MVAPKSMKLWIASDNMPSEPVNSPAANLVAASAALAAIEASATDCFSEVDMAALYRPGQTIQYKGIALSVDTTKDNYEVLAGRKLSVAFLDPNGKEIAKAEHACNDYGSFSGSFTRRI